MIEQLIRDDRGRDQPCVTLGPRFEPSIVAARTETSSQSKYMLLFLPCLHLLLTSTKIVGESTTEFACFIKTTLCAMTFSALTTCEHLAA